MNGLKHVLREWMLDIEPGTAACPGGGRGEYLVALAEFWDQQQLQHFEQFAQHLMHGKPPSLVLESNGSHNHCPSAFIGGLELALPALTGDTGTLPTLELM